MFTVIDKLLTRPILLIYSRSNYSFAKPIEKLFDTRTHSQGYITVLSNVSEIHHGNLSLAAKTKGQPDFRGSEIRFAHLHLNHAPNFRRHTGAGTPQTRDGVVVIHAADASLSVNPLPEINRGVLTTHGVKLGQCGGNT